MLAQKSLRGTPCRPVRGFKTPRHKGGKCQLNLTYKPVPARCDMKQLSPDAARRCVSRDSYLSSKSLHQQVPEGARAVPRDLDCTQGPRLWILDTGTDPEAVKPGPHFASLSTSSPHHMQFKLVSLKCKIQLPTSLTGCQQKWMALGLAPGQVTS